MNNDARLSHTACDHAKTPAGRKACRAGDAVIRQTEAMDTIWMGDTAYLVKNRTRFEFTPAEVQVAVFQDGNGWVDLGWMFADRFAGGRVEKDPRNV